MNQMAIGNFVMGMALGAMSFTLGGSNVKDLFLRPHDGTFLRVNACRHFCSRQIHCKTGINEQKFAADA